MKRSTHDEALGANPALAAEVRVEQVTLLYRYVPLSLAANLLIAVCVALSLHGDIGSAALAPWLSLLAAALVLRLGPYVAARRRLPDAQSATRYERLFSLGACATGAVWGFSFPLLGVAELPEAQRWFAYAVLTVSGAGIAAGGVFVMSYRLWPALLFMGSILVPAFFYFAYSGGREWVLAALIVIYFAFLYRSVAMASNVTLNNMLLRREATASARSAHASQLERDAAAEEFRRVSEALPDLLLKLDASGRILLANRNAQAVLAGESGDLLGRNIAGFLAQDRSDVVTGLWREVQAKGAHRAELRLRTAAGEAPYLLSAAGVRDADGRVVALVSVAQDVSSLKAIEAQLGRARDLAEQASRAKSEFVANMSHEIRTPLNAVIGFSELALHHELSPAVKEYVSNIHQSGAHLLSVVNDILDFSKIEAGKLEIEAAPFDLPALLDMLGAQGRMPSLNKGIGFEVVQDARLPRMLRGDATRLSQILANLVSNAIKFTETGRVEVRVELVSRQDTRATLRFSVRDTGIGMSPEQIERIFRPFTQADASTTRRFGGTGLGLTICSRLVALMGGRLEVESRTGEGSCFTVALPLEVVDVPVDASAANRTQTGIRFEGRHALLVEDNPVNRRLAEAALKKLGLTVDMAADGREAVTRIEAAPQAYDVVFMDVQMPILDGMEATRQIRRNPSARSLPIIAMTANAFEQDRARCLAAGMNDFVAKPFALKDMAAALARCLG